MTVLLRFLAVLVLLPIAAHAEDTRFTISGVPVEAAGESATAAKDAALSQGQVEAFSRLMEQEDPAKAEQRAAAFSPDQIANMVHGFEVNDEKIGEKSYKAMLTVHFDPAQIDRVMKLTQGISPTAVSDTGAQGAPAMMSDGGSMLIIPLLKGDNALTLWENNPWRTSWSNVALEKGAGEIVVPSGDQTDRTNLSAFTASKGDFKMLKPMAERYGTDSLIVAEASYKSGVSPVSITVTLRRVSAAGQTVTSSVYDSESRETPDALFARIARDVSDQLRGVGSRAGSDPRIEEREMTVLAQVTSVEDWVALRRQLTSVPSVLGADLGALSFRQADIKLRYRGTPDMLARALMAKGMRLSLVGNYWAISLP